MEQMESCRNPALLQMVPSRAVALRAVGTLSALVAFLGLGGSLQISFLGWETAWQERSRDSVGNAALSISSAMGTGIPSTGHLCQSLMGGLIHRAL